MSLDRFKIVAYPAFGVAQLWLARPRWLGPILMSGLIGLAYMALKRELKRHNDREEQSDAGRADAK